MGPSLVRAMSVIVAAGAFISLAACAPSPSFEDDVAAARAAHGPTVRPAAPSASPSATIDLWAGHYDERMQGRTSTEAMSMYGSFGPPGSVAPAQMAGQGLESGDHLVQLECVGVETIDMTLAAVVAGDDGEPLEGEQLDTTSVECPSVYLLQVVTTEPGLLVRLDSHGEPGGFLVRVDPSDVTVIE